MKLGNPLSGLVQRLRKPVDAILVGERHTDEAHPRKEAEIIRHYAPEYVLSEGLDSLTPEHLRHLVKSYEIVTLGEFCEGIRQAPQEILADEFWKALQQKIANNQEEYRELCQEDGMSNSDIARELKQQMKQGVVPRTRKQFLETPVYALNFMVYNTLRDTFFNYSDGSVEGATKAGYRRIQQFLRLRRSSRYGEHSDHAVYRACAQMGCELAGCDIDKKVPTGLDEVKWEEDDDSFDDSLGTYFDRLNAYIHEKNPERERVMGQRIIEYAERRKTDRPVVAIVGANHLRKYSDIFPLLDERGVTYKTRVLKPSRAKKPLEDLFYAINLGS